MGFKKSQNTIIGFVLYVSAICRVSSSVVIDSVKFTSEKEGSRSLYAIDTDYSSSECSSFFFSTFDGSDYYGNVAYCTFSQPSLNPICPITSYDIIQIKECARELGQNKTCWTTHIGGQGPNKDSFGCPPGSANEGALVDPSLVNPFSLDCDSTDSNCGLFFGTDPNNQDITLIPAIVSKQEYSATCYKQK